MKDIYNPGRPFVMKSPYGDRADPYKSNSREFHAGVDFAAPAGTPIPAATSGVVVYSGRNSGFGNTVVVRNATGDYSLYAHMQDGDRVMVGQRVWPGDAIGRVGSTGERAKGNHLHYSLIPASAGGAIENPNLPRDGGPIGIRVNGAHTIDPAIYDPQPHLDQSQRASEILSGLDEKSSRNGGSPPDHLGAPFFNPFSPVPAAGFVPLPNALAASGAPANFADRYGNWAAKPGLNNISAPAPQVTPDQGKRSDADDDTPVRILSRVNLSSASASGDAPMLAPASAPPLLGIFSGKPMRDYPVRPSIFATDDRSSPDDDELYQRWRRWLDA